MRYWKPPGFTNTCSCAPSISMRSARSVILCSQAAQRSASSSTIPASR